MVGRILPRVSAGAFRPDLEGLRAVAVVLILLYHAGVTGLPGGYVGVDIFFVLSGFLITGLLTRELDSTGTLDLRSFYARRARRILPASFLVLGAALVGSTLLLSPIGLWHAAREIASAALYVPNFLFAVQTSDYFHPGRTSPVLHFWSLGVEEQFYLLWPAFLMLARRAGARTAPRMALQVAVVVAGSLALSLFFSPRQPSHAFFLLPTRAWEFGVGALLSLGELSLRRMTTRVANAAGSLGLAMVGSSAILFDAHTSFPGAAAVLPVLGTGLVVAAGAGRRDAWSAILLSWRPFRYVGRISYSLYLWHWPLIVLGAIALHGRLPPAWQAPVEVAASVLLAAATYRWIEDPLRRGRLIGTLPWRNLSAAVALSVAIVVVAFGAGQMAILRFESVPVAAATPIVGDPLAGLIPARGPTPGGLLPPNLTPPLLDPLQAVAGPDPGADGCFLDAGQTVSRDCTYGDQASSTELVLLGDSHAAQWFPALEQIALQRNWRVVVLVKAGCPYQDVPVTNGASVIQECDTWRASVLTRIAAESPALVIVSGDHRIRPAANGVALDGSAALTAMRDGAARTIARLESSGAKVAVIADTPVVPEDPADCLSSNPDDLLRCAIPRDVALDTAWFAMERAVALSLKATFIDSSAWVCPSDPCPMVIGRFAVYSDTNHITHPFAQALATRLAASLPH